MEELPPIDPMADPTRDPASVINREEVMREQEYQDHRDLSGISTPITDWEALKSYTNLAHQDGMDNVVGLQALNMTDDGEMTPEEVKEQYGIDTDSNMGHDKARFISEVRDKRDEAQFWISQASEDAQSSWLYPLIGGFVGNATNITTLGMGIATGMLAPLALPTLAGAGAWGVVGMIATENIFETAIEEAFYTNYYSELTGEDYTFNDSMQNFGMNALMVGGLHVAGKGLKYGVKKAGTLAKRAAYDFAYDKKRFTRLAKDEAFKVTMVSDAAVQLEARKHVDPFHVHRAQMEDVWDGIEDGHVPFSTPENLKAGTIYGVSNSLNEISVNTMHDLDHSTKDSFVMSSSQGMAAKNAQTRKGYLVEGKVREDASVINYGQVLTKDGGDGIFSGTDVFTELHKITGDNTLRENIDTVGDLYAYIQEKIDSGDNKWNQIKDDVDDFFGARGVDIIMEDGGKFADSDFGGQYDHSAIRILNKDAVEFSDPKQPLPGTNKRNKPRVYGQDEYQNHLNSEETDLDYNQDTQDGIKTKTNDMANNEIKAPKDGTEASMDALAAKQEAKVKEDSAQVEKLLGGNEEIKNKMENLSNEEAASSPATENKVVKAIQDTIDCKKGLT